MTIVKFPRNIAKHGKYESKYIQIVSLGDIEQIYHLYLFIIFVRHMKLQTI